MKHINQYENFSENYKGLYITPEILEKTYCRFLHFYSDEVQRTILDLCNYINNKYKSYLVVKMIPDIEPGFIASDKADIEKISKEIYEFLKNRNVESRVVYGEGTVGSWSNNIHHCDTGRKNGTLLVKIGRYTDSLKGQYGIFTT